MKTDAQRRAEAKYRKNNIVLVAVGLNRKTDKDIVEWILKEPNKSRWMKQAMRYYIADRITNSAKAVENSEEEE